MKLRKRTVLSIFLALSIVFFNIGCGSTKKTTTTNQPTNKVTKKTSQNTNTQTTPQVNQNTQTAADNNAAAPQNANSTAKDNSSLKTSLGSQIHNIVQTSAQAASTQVSTAVSTANSTSTATTDSASNGDNTPVVPVVPPIVPPVPDPTPETITLDGYIIDQDCFSPNSNPGDDNKNCLLMKSCAASGYGIGVLQSNGTYKFYYFDGEFAPTATGTQVKAHDLIENTTKNTHIYITVKGIIKGDTKTVDGTVYQVITVASLAEETEPIQPPPTAAEKYYDGWLSDSSNVNNTSNPTKIAKISLKNNDYGIVIVQDDDSLKFFKFNDEGQKLAKEGCLNTTSKTSDLRIKVKGIIDGDTIKITSIEEEQELIGIVLSKSNFEANSSNPTKVKRDDIVAKDSAASGYGVALKQSDGTYKFYALDESGNKSAASLLNWYVRWGDNIGSIPILVQGVVKGDSIVTSRVIRERYIPGQLTSKYIADQDKALKDITRADLLTPESLNSGYGYYVHSCGGHEFFPFDEDSNQLIKNFIESSKTQGKIKVIPKGFWYWIGSTIKVTSISENTDAENTPETPVNEKYTGIISTRNYFKSSEYENNGGPGTITKDFLLDAKNAASGYGIIYNTCCNYGYLRFDDAGTKLIKDIITNSKNSSNIRVVVQGTRDEDTIHVTKVTEAYSQTFSGALIKNADGKYAVKVKQIDGTFKLYKLEENGDYYHSSGQKQAADFLTKIKKETTTVDLKGYFDGENILVTNITENLSIDTSTSVQTITGYLEDVHCFYAYTDAAKDSRGCLLMKSCAASGYGITVPQADGSKKFYFFDGDFATNSGGTFTVGTGSQLAAWNLVQNSIRKNNFTVKVTGTFDETEKNYTDKSGINHSFPVIKVASLSEPTLNSVAITAPASKLTYSVGDALDISGLQVTGSYSDGTNTQESISAANVTGFDSSKAVSGKILTITVGGKTTTYTVDINPKQVTFTGYIQDEDCFVTYVPDPKTGVATEDPGDDSRGCLLMKQCAGSGYGVTVKQADGTYKYYYFDGDFASGTMKNFIVGTGAQKTSWDLINNTKKQDHVTIKVTGTIDGSTRTNTNVISQASQDDIYYPVIKVISLEEVTSN